MLRKSMVGLARRAKARFVLSAVPSIGSPLSGCDDECVDACGIAVGRMSSASALFTAIRTALTPMGFSGDFDHPAEFHSRDSAIGRSGAGQLFLAPFRARLAHWVHCVYRNFAG